MVLYLNLHSTNHNDVLCRDCEQVSQSCSKPLYGYYGTRWTSELHK